MPFKRARRGPRRRATRAEALQISSARPISPLSRGPASAYPSGSLSCGMCATPSSTRRSACGSASASRAATIPRSGEPFDPPSGGTGNGSARSRRGRERGARAGGPRRGTSARSGSSALGVGVPRARAPRRSAWRGVPVEGALPRVAVAGPAVSSFVTWRSLVRGQGPSNRSTPPQPHPTALQPPSGSAPAAAASPRSVRSSTSPRSSWFAGLFR